MATATIPSRRLRIALAATFGAGFLALGWGAGLMRFAAAIPDTVVDATTPTDAIVVLTGGSERLTTGLSLLDQGLARQVFVSGVHPDVDTSAMLGAAGEVHPELIARIEVGHGARNTAGNARETAAWLRRHGYRSLRLVTASYHMPRSLFEFEQVLPEVTIIPHPVFPSHVKQARWWAWPGTAALIIGEYHKFLWAWLRHGALRLAARSGSDQSRRMAQ
jgi:uncharacterized SAM-binding protein YcdF (DUF218 family)